jgi:hypothetical protein
LFTEVTVSAKRQRDGKYLVSVDGTKEMVVESFFYPDADFVNVRCIIDGSISASSVIVRGNSVHVYSVVSIIIRKFSRGEGKVFPDARKTGE